MIVTRNNDKLIIKELKRRNLYDQLHKQPRIGKEDVLIISDFKDSWNGDIFIWHSNFPEAKDNGYSWIHLENASEDERRGTVAGLAHIVVGTTTQEIWRLFPAQG